MKVLTTHEYHYLRYEDGVYDPRNYTTIEMYGDLLSVFDKIVLVARCKKVKQKPDCLRVDNDRIECLPVADFKGNTGYLGQMQALWQCRNAVGLADRYWLRAPGFMATMVAFWLRRAGIPFFMHVVGDPAGIAETKTEWLPGFMARPLVHIVRTRFQKHMLSSSGGLAVTESTLQKIYPSSIPENDFGVSDVKLLDSVFQKVRRDFAGDTFKIVMTAVFAKYKGHCYLFEALKKVKQMQSRSVELYLIGQGPLRSRLETMAKELGLDDCIHFCGRIDWGPKLFAKLDEAHLFILSSVAAEGMPRAMLEGMARGLPVVATDVGGIPEIIDRDMLVPIRNSAALAEKIVSVMNDPQKLEILSCRNYRRAQDFGYERLQRLRKAWFSWIHDDGHNPENLTWTKYIKEHRIQVSTKHI